jgi:hypothetical protein
VKSAIAHADKVSEKTGRSSGRHNLPLNVNAEAPPLIAEVGYAVEVVGRVVTWLDSKQIIVDAIGKST